MAKVITFISAAKNVGKTHMAVNLALQLGRSGHRTCLFNADAETAAIHDLLGLHPGYSLEDLIYNRCQPENVLLEKSNGTAYFPGSPGIESMGDVNAAKRDRMVRDFGALNRYDFFLIDTAPGASREVTAFCGSSSEIILVMTPDSDSVTDAYALLETLLKNGFTGSVMVLINKSREVKDARRSYGKFKEAVQAQLPITLLPLGTVFHHRYTAAAQVESGPVILRDPESDTSRCILNIARHLAEKEMMDGDMSDFWNRIFDAVSPPPRPIQSSATPDSTGTAAPETDTRSISPTLRQVLQKILDVSAFSADELNRSYGELHAVLNRVLERMDFISRNLAEMKEILSKQQTSSSESPEMENGEGFEESEKIPLDFEAFLRQQQTNG